MEKLSADTAALVAAQLTQARATMLGGVMAGRKQGNDARVAPDWVEHTYARYLAFVTEGKSPPPGGTGEA